MKKDNLPYDESENKKNETNSNDFSKVFQGNFMDQFNQLMGDPQQREAMNDLMNNPEQLGKMNETLESMFKGGPLSALGGGDSKAVQVIKEDVMKYLKAIFKRVKNIEGKVDNLSQKLEESGIFEIDEKE